MRVDVIWVWNRLSLSTSRAVVPTGASLSLANVPPACAPASVWSQSVPARLQLALTASRAACAGDQRQHRRRLLRQHEARRSADHDELSLLGAPPHPALQAPLFSWFSGHQGHPRQSPPGEAPLAVLPCSTRRHRSVGFSSTKPHMFCFNCTDNDSPPLWRNRSRSVGAVRAFTDAARRSCI